MKRFWVSKNACHLLAGSCLSALSFLPTAAVAQTDPPAAASQTAAEETSGADIIITGSRIQKTGYDQPTPVTVQTTEALLASAPSNIPDALNKLPHSWARHPPRFAAKSDLSATT